MQYSVFLLPLAGREKAETLAAQLLGLIDPDEDDVRLYPVKNAGLRFGVAPNLDEPLVVT